MKILVTGVKGQLGFDVVNELEKRGHTAIGVDIEEMDITNKESVNTVIHGTNPDGVIHCAAWTAVDAAEEEENKEKSHGSQCIRHTLYRRSMQRFSHPYDVYFHRLYL